MEDGMKSWRLVIAASIPLLAAAALPRLVQRVAAAPVAYTGTLSVIYGDVQPGSGGAPRARYMLYTVFGPYSLQISDAVLTAGGGAAALNRRSVDITGDEFDVRKILVTSIRLSGG